jgi:3-oxoacyl-[acyl-carrier protein] reductase
MRNFKGKTVLVVGGSHGIGLEVSKDFLAAGAKVLVHGNSEPHMNDAKALLFSEECKDRLTFFKINLMSTENVQELINQVHNVSSHIDICIIAIGGPLDAKTSDPSKKYAETIQLNLLVPVDITRYVIEGMLNRAYGRIVYIGSLVTENFMAELPYIVAKSSLKAYVQGMASHVAKLDPNIVLSMVSPGPIRVKGKGLDRMATESQAQLDSWLRDNRISARRLGTVSEVSRAILFLASDEATYMHGANVRVDGGAL